MSSEEALKQCTEERDTALMLIGSLLQAIAPFAARHHQDKCYCDHCNTLRRVMLIAARHYDKYQATVL